MYISQLASNWGETFSTKGNYFSFRDRTSLKLWDVNNKKLSYTIPVSIRNGELGFSPDETKLITTFQNNNRTVIVWDTATGKEIISFSAAIRPIVFTPDFSHVLLGMCLYNVETWERINDLNFLGHPRDAAYSPDGAQIVISQSWGGFSWAFGNHYGRCVARLCDAETGKEIKSFSLS